PGWSVLWPPIAVSAIAFSFRIVTSGLYVEGVFMRRSSAMLRGVSHSGRLSLGCACLLIGGLLVGSLATAERANAEDIIWASLVSEMDDPKPDQGFLDILMGLGHNVMRFEVDGDNSPLPPGDID